MQFRLEKAEPARSVLWLLAEVSIGCTPDADVRDIFIFHGNDPPWCFGKTEADAVEEEVK